MKIVHTRFDHINELALTMRPEDVAEIAASSGSAPLLSLMNGKLNSDTCVTLLSKDNEVLAIGGVVRMKDEGYSVPWMLCSTLAEKHKLGVVKVMKEQNQKWLKKYQLLQNRAWVHNPAHVQLIKLLGYETQQIDDWVYFRMQHHV